jgi:hypothetical protein
VRIAAIAALVVALAAVSTAPAAQAPKRTSLTGTIKVLKLKKITVHGKRDLTCRITALSPRVALRGFTLGKKAKITCVKGVLSAIARPAKASGSPPMTAEPVSPSDTQTAPKLDPAPDPFAPGPGTGGVKVAPNVTGNSTITALGGGMIEFGNAISCQLTSSSPSVAAYRVGSRVAYTCTGGALTSIGAGEGV